MMPGKVTLKKKRSSQKKSHLTSGHMLMGSAQAGFMHIRVSARRSAQTQKPELGIRVQGFRVCLSSRDTSFSFEGHQLWLPTWYVGGGGRDGFQAVLPVIFPWHSP